MVRFVPSAIVRATGGRIRTMSDRVKLAREIAARTEARLVETKTPSGGLEGGSVYEHYL